MRISTMVIETDNRQLIEYVTLVVTDIILFFLTIGSASASIKLILREGYLLLMKICSFF